MLFFMHFIYRKNKSRKQKMTMPRGNLLEIFSALGLCHSFCAENTLQNCTKTNLQRNQTNCVLTVGSRIWRFFIQFRYRKNKSQDQKMTMPRGNLLEIFFALRLCHSFCAENTLQSCAKTNLQRNQTNGVLTVGSRIWRFFLYNLHTERTNRRTKKWPCHAEISWKYFFD
jgi:hypothetical protein